MKSSILLAIIVNLCGATLFAAVPGLAVKLPVGWTESDAVSPITGKLAPATFRCIPKDDANAEILITIMGQPKGAPVDANALVRILRQTSRQYQSSETETYAIKDLKLEGGIAKYASFEDPDLKGKPVQKGKYKVATPFTILFADGTLAYATVLSDSSSGAQFNEALAIVSSAKYAGKPAPARTFVQKLDAGGMLVGNGTLDAVLTINPKDETFQRVPGGDSGYFSLASENGVIFSGWLEPAAKYEGFKTLWQRDRSRMEEGMGVAIRNEKELSLGGWEAVTYTIELSPQMVQSNLRACKTVGKTWFDVHLSITDEKDQTAKLKAVLQSCEAKLK
jgi:hypothetical protein